MDNSSQGETSACSEQLLQKAISMVRPTLGLLALFCIGVDGHGFVINPPTRNAVDKDLPLFADGL
jgi:hypothetical protein